MTYFKKHIIPYICVTGLGVLLHFTYEWSGKNSIVGLFSPVNESTWEHLKLIFFPMLLLTIWNILYSHRGDFDFLPARTIGILAAMGFTIVSFYTYIGVIGHNIDFINIILYFLAVAFGFRIENRMYGKAGFLNPCISLAILFIVILLFALFTYTAPRIGIFRVP